jgi:zinc protease
LSRRARASGARWTTDAGIGVLLEESHALPLVDVDLILRAGALHDPVGKEGLARLAARMLRMGTRKLTSDAVDEAIELLPNVRTRVGAEDHLPVEVVLLDVFAGDPLREVAVEEILEPEENAVGEHLARAGHQVAVDLVGAGPVLLHVTHLVDVCAQ